MPKPKASDVAEDSSHLENNSEDFKRREFVDAFKLADLFEDEFECSL